MVLVGSNGLLNPAHVVADLGVDSRLVLQGTAIAPGHDTLEFSIADHGATGVTLSRGRDNQCSCLWSDRGWGGRCSFCFLGC